MSTNSALISVSDDDSDDPAGKLKVRIHRNRNNRNKKIKFQARILTRFLKRHWCPFLLLLLAIGLLIFQTYKLALKPDSTKDVDIGSEPVTESPANLNRLDPVMRVVAGVRQPCLKILPPKEIQKLEFPGSAEPNSPIKKVVYKSNSGNYYQGSNTTLFMQNAKATRFNLFTGIQTLQEREESFKASETTEVHCGFYSDQGGFKISEDDKSYMLTCKAVVSTCAFGGGDDLYQPIGMTDASLEKVCYVAFWDEITRISQEAEGKKINEDHMIGKWRIVVVKDLPFSDQRLNGKIPKMLSHRFFPQARYSIWVDSKSQFRRDPLGVLEALLWRTNSILAISEHGARSSLYDEAKAVVKKNKATPEEVEVQLNQYRREGIPDDKRFNGKKVSMQDKVIDKIKVCMLLKE